MSNVLRASSAERIWKHSTQITKMEEDEDKIDPAEFEKAARTVVIGKKSILDVSKSALDKDKKPVTLRSALSVHAKFNDNNKADDDDDEDEVEEVRRYNLPGGRNKKEVADKRARRIKKKVTEAVGIDGATRKLLRQQQQEKSKFVDDNSAKAKRAKLKANIGQFFANATDALEPDEVELPAWFNPAYRPATEPDKNWEDEPEIVRWFNRLQARYELILANEQRKLDSSGRSAIEKRIMLPENLHDGGMTVIDATSTRLLLLREGDIYFCTTPVCPTHGAPLNNGAFHAHIVHCPLYGCGFDVRTGEAVEGPNLVNIVSITIAIYASNCITLNCPQQDDLVADDSRPLSYAARISIEPPLPLPLLVIVGGGLAAICACVTLRNYGFNGHVLMFDQNAFFPIDKRAYILTAADNPTVTATTYKTPELAALAAAAFVDAQLLKPYAWYVKHNIQFQPNRSVKDVRTEQREIVMENGDRVSYDKLLITTGMNSQLMFRSLETHDLVPGCDLRNVFSAYDVAQARYAVRQAEEKRCVVIGSSVYAFEIACALRKKARSLCLVHTDERLVPELGPHASATYVNELRKSGVSLHLRHYLHCINGAPGTAAEGNRVISIILRTVSATSENIKQGSYKLSTKEHKKTPAATAASDADLEIPCDFVVLCSQTRPSTEFVTPTDVKRSADEFIMVNEYMEAVSKRSGTGVVNDVYACGDCCQVQLPHIVSGRSGAGEGVAAGEGAAYNVQGQKMKCATARLAALNLCGVAKLRTPLTQCPMQWCTCFGRSFISAGYIDWLKNDLENDYDFVMHGSLEEEKYAVFYCRRSDGICDAVLTSNYIPTASMFAYIKSHVGKRLRKEQLLPDSLIAPNLPRLGRTYLSQQLIPRYYAAVSIKRARVSVPQDLLLLAGMRDYGGEHQKKSAHKTSALTNAVDMHSRLLGPLFVKEQFSI